MKFKYYFGFVGAPQLNALRPFSGTLMLDDLLSFIQSVERNNLVKYIVGNHKIVDVIGLKISQIQSCMLSVNQLYVRLSSLSF